MSLPKTTISTRPTCTCVHLSNYWHVLMHVGLPWTYMNLVLPEGARKLGGRRGCSRRGTFVHALLCSTALLTFFSKYSDFFFTYDTTCNLLAGICNHQRKRVHVAGGGGGGGGGGNCCQRGGISYAMGEGGGSWPPHPQGYA